MDIPFLSAIMQDERKKALFILGATAVFTIVYIALGVFPQIKSIVEVSQEIRTVASDMKTTSSEIKKLDANKNALEEYKAKFDAVKKRLLMQEEEIPHLLETISKMAKESGVKIVGIKPAPAPRAGERRDTKGPIAREVSILITAKCGFHELGEFLSRIENSEKFVKVLDIGVLHNKAAPIKHDVSLVVAAYVLNPEKE